MSQWHAADILRITAQPGYRVVGAPAPRPVLSDVPVVLALPYPPSTNHYLQRSTGKIRHTKATVAYFTHVEQIISTLDDHSFPLRGDLTLWIDVHPADRRRRDFDNLLKVPLDALQQAGVYRDDYQITTLHLFRQAPAEPAHLVVTIAAEGMERL